MKISQKWAAALVITGLLLGLWNIAQLAGQLAKDPHSDKTEASEEDQVSLVSEWRKKLAVALNPHLMGSPLPLELALDANNPEEFSKISYSIRQDLQDKSDQILRQYKPDYGAIVLMEADTGRLLSLSQFIKTDEAKYKPFYAFPLPAASVFKIVTAAAAIDKYQFSPESTLNFMGGNYTLYKRNVVGPQNSRWSQRVTLREAFARSFNTAFGRLAIENLQAADLIEYAFRFGFNREIPSELSIPLGKAQIPQDPSAFEMAELASGFNKVTQMSAVHGAMIAGAIANEGLLVAPSLVDRVTSKDQEVLFQNQSIPLDPVLSKAAAADVRKLMNATLEIGTSRKSFLSFKRRKILQSIEMGGKTGSLTSPDPKGKLDWFVGFIQETGQKPISISVVTVHEKYWTVKSATVAQQVFAKYIGDTGARNFKRRADRQ